MFLGFSGLFCLPIEPLYISNKVLLAWLCRHKPGSDTGLVCLFWIPC